MCDCTVRTNAIPRYRRKLCRMFCFPKTVTHRLRLLVVVKLLAFVTAFPALPVAGPAAQHPRPSCRASATVPLKHASGTGRALTRALGRRPERLGSRPRCARLPTEQFTSLRRRSAYFRFHGIGSDFISSHLQSPQTKLIGQRSRSRSNDSPFGQRPLAGLLGPDDIGRQPFVITRQGQTFRLAHVAHNSAAAVLHAVSNHIVRIGPFIVPPIPPLRPGIDPRGSPA